MKDKIKNEFWKNWKNKTDLEKNAILSVKKAMNFLLLNIPRNKITAIYVKGTFVTREMNKRSDIDIVPILSDNHTLKKLQRIRNENKDVLKPAELLPISLTELKNNKNAKHRGPLKGKPDTFLRDLKHHKLIYGEKLKKSDYPMRKSDELFRVEVTTLKNQTIPLHKKGEYGFQQLIKQVFWVCYHEQERLGKSPPRTWKSLNSFIKDKEHIIHKAYYFRKHHTKDKQKRREFVRFLEKFISHLKT